MYFPIFSASYTIKFMILYLLYVLSLVSTAILKGCIHPLIVEARNQHQELVEEDQHLNTLGMKLA